MNHRLFAFFFGCGVVIIIYYYPVPYLTNSSFFLTSRPLEGGGVNEADRARLSSGPAAPVILTEVRCR